MMNVTRNWKVRTLVWACALGWCAGVLGDGAEAAEAGVTAAWVPTAAGTYSITNLANWSGTDRIPTNAADTVHFAPGPAAIEGAQTIQFPTVKTSRHVWDLGTFDGAANQVLCGGLGNTANNSAIIRLGNPNGFPGSYETQDFNTTWRVSATEAFTPFLASVKTARGPIVEVEGSGTARIGRLDGGEVLQKAGTGDLAIDDVTSVAATRIRTNGGTLTVALAPSEAAPTLPVAAPAVWFDAARVDTLTVDAEPDANGRRFVAEWSDANGGAVCARPFDAATRPFLSAVAQADDGTPLVDFGAYRGEENRDQWDAFAAAYGPAGALRLSEDLAGVREVFVVWGDWAAGASSCVFVLGHTSTFEMHRASGDCLLNGNYSVGLHADDETWIDGVRRTWTYGPYDYTGLTVASMNISGAGASINALAYDRGLRKGGCRIAEVILYTNALTSAERQAVHGYLLAKWKGRERMLRELCLTADAAVRVPEGRALDVATLTAPKGGTLTKAGAGTLTVADVAYDKTSLRVAEGRVAFAETPAPDGTTAPAANPELWLDAAAADSLVAQEVADDATGRAYISAWKDCRGASRTLRVEVPQKAVKKGNYPFVVADAACGRPTVDFGGGWFVRWGGKNGQYEDVANDSTYMEIPNGGAVAAREGFTVVRMKMPNGLPETDRACLDPSLFASYEMPFARYNVRAILSNFAHPTGLAAQWWVDGVPVWPCDESFDPGTNVFHVVNFSSCAPLRVRGVAFDRWDIWGGMQVCETIFYARTLSHAERAATMAYLRQKWQGAAPAGRQLDVLAYEAGAETSLACDGPLTVARVALPEGAATFTVTGGGTVTARDVNLGPDKGLVVDGGAFVVSAGAEGLPEPVYHFDATDAASLETATTEAGATSVLKWKDVRGNGVYAEAGSGVYMKARPTLRTVETRDGKTMPVLDFGDAAQGDVKPDTAAGMVIRGTDGRVQELHVIYSDAGETFNGIGHRFIFSDSATYSFHRDDANGSIFGAYYKAAEHDCVKYGYVGVDGEAVSWTWPMTDRAFHLVSAAPTNAVFVRTIANDRGCRAGGSRQGELIAFRTPLSEAQRAYLQRRLMWKWFGTGEAPAWGFEAASLRVRKGGRIAFAGNVEVAAAALGGAGTVEATRVMGVKALAPGEDAADGTGRLALVGDLELAENAEIALGFRGVADYDAVAVSGAVALPRAAHVALAVAPGLMGVRGRFRVLAADGAVTGGENVRGWTVAEENANAFSFALEADEQGVWLVARPKGTVLLLR